jgi:hypothetical protein
MPASRRVSPSERFRAQLDELFDSGRELGQVLEEVARLGVRLLFQVALEAEVTEFLTAIATPAAIGYIKGSATATPRSR